MLMIELNEMKQGNEPEKREGGVARWRVVLFQRHGYVGFYTIQGITSENVQMYEQKYCV